MVDDYLESVAPFAGAWIEIVDDIIKPSFVSSLPSRERGLKSIRFDVATTFLRSLPSRERGSKCCSLDCCHSAIQSLPSRERGLKFF